jgi:thiamine pyrophosphate-dependent acetolactate synthase large subunit-like protein
VLNGVASATLDRVPMLAISGQIESSREQFFTHQVIDHDRMFAPVSKLALRLDPASADTVIRKALRTAVAERPGAVHLTVTADAWPVPAQGQVNLPPLAPAAASVDVRCAEDRDGDPVRTLMAARRPVILAGIAALRCAAGPELVRLAELAGIPVVVSPMAKGVFPEDHPYFAGVLDMAGYRVVWDLLAGADLILAGRLNPSDVVAIAREAAPPGTILTTDVGSHKIMAGQVWQASEPRSVLIPNGLSAMGFGVPAAIAARLTRPDRPVIALVGDGGFAMAATEMRIASALGLPVTVVVFADNSLNRIELRQQLMGYPPTATRIDGMDLVTLAEAMDCDGIRADSPAALEKALDGFATRSRPLIVEARVDPAQYETQF